MRKWKKVEGYEAEVTKRGKVRNSETGEIKVQYTDKNGYKFVSVKLNTGVNTKWTTRKVHTLVALAFVKGFKEGLQVNHRNFRKSDNYYRNLEWVTTQENTKHSVDNGRLRPVAKYGDEHLNAKLDWGKVKYIKRQVRKGRYTQKELADRFGVHNSVICGIMKGRAWVIAKNDPRIKFYEKAKRTLSRLARL